MVFFCIYCQRDKFISILNKGITFYRIRDPFNSLCPECFSHLFVQKSIRPYWFKSPSLVHNTSSFNTRSSIRKFYRFLYIKIRYISAQFPVPALYTDKKYTTRPVFSNNCKSSCICSPLSIIKICNGILSYTHFTTKFLFVKSNLSLMKVKDDAHYLKI